MGWKFPVYKTFLILREDKKWEAKWFPSKSIFAAPLGLAPLAQKVIFAIRGNIKQVVSF